MRRRQDGMAVATKPAKTIQVVHGLSRPMAAQLSELIKKHVDAQVADSWKGGGDPSDIPIIEAEAELARVKLIAFIERLVREAE